MAGVYRRHEPFLWPLQLLRRAGREDRTEAAPSPPVCTFTDNVRSAMALPTSDTPTRRDQLLSQEAYADRIGVSPSWVSKATKNQKVVSGKYVPARDAVVDEEGNLIGYEEPTPRPHGGGGTTSGRSPSGGSPEGGPTPGGTSAPQGQAGPAPPQDRTGGGTKSTSGRSHGNVRQDRRRNPSTPRGMRGGEDQPSGQRSAANDNSSEGIDNFLEALGGVVAQRPDVMYPLLRLVGAVGGAFISVQLGGRNLPVALSGGAAGLLITEYCLHAPLPERRSQLGRPTRLRLPMSGYGKLAQ